MAANVHFGETGSIPRHFEMSRVKNNILPALALAVCDKKRRNIANVMQGFKKIRKQQNSSKNTVGLLLEHLWSLERFYCSDFGNTNMPRYGNYLHIS